MSGRVRIGTCADLIDAAFIRSMFSARGIGVVIGAEHHASLLGPIAGGFLSLDIWVASEDAEDAVALLRDVRDGKASGPDDALDDALDDGAPPEVEDPEDLDGDAEWLVRGKPGSGAPDEDDPEVGASRDADDGDDDDGDGDEDRARRAAGRRALATLPTADLRARKYRQRRTVFALLSGVFITFGTAHLFTGAWMRGLALAALEIIGFMHAAAGHSYGVAAVAAAIVTDLAGTSWRMWSEARDRAWSDARARLPAAGDKPPVNAKLPAARLHNP